ncbi:MAG: hypothetical protein OXD38_10895 [Aestuariivita sp.]|nr:hypothetical protein [Aestuariivita sp.]
MAGGGVINKPPATSNGHIVPAIPTFAYRNPRTAKQWRFQATTEGGNAPEEFYWRLKELANTGLIRSIDKPHAACKGFDFPRSEPPLWP